MAGPRSRGEEGRREGRDVAHLGRGGGGSDGAKRAIKRARRAGVGLLRAHAAHGAEGGNAVERARRTAEACPRAAAPRPSPAPEAGSHRARGARRREQRGEAHRKRLVRARGRAPARGRVLSRWVLGRVAGFAAALSGGRPRGRRGLLLGHVIRSRAGASRAPGAFGGMQADQMGAEERERAEPAGTTRRSAAFCF